MNNAIEMQNLTKKYGQFKAVNNLSLKIPEGKIYGFLGKNGAGKTTTIRMIMGLITPDEGKINIFGKDIREDHRWVARNVGGIVEIPGFYENLTAKENLELTARMYNITNLNCDELLNFVQLDNVENKKSGKFSLGMKQRLGIANSLVHSPKILILDEPSNGLDPSGIRDMRTFLKNLTKQKGITIMISSHILSEVQQIADFVGIIDKGSLVEETTIDSINDADQKSLLLEVDSVDKAISIIENMNLTFDLEDGKFKIFCKKEMNSYINKNLLKNNINVLSLSPQSQSLEDLFLYLTERKIEIKEMAT